jgi:hypothetical protein
MAKFTFKNYNLFLARAIRETGGTRREAAQIYREIKAKTGKSVFSTYFDRHPKIARRVSSGVIQKRRGNAAGSKNVDARSLPPRQREEEETEDQQDLDFEATGDGGDYKKAR